LVNDLVQQIKHEIVLKQTKKKILISKLRMCKLKFGLRGNEKKEKKACELKVLKWLSKNTNYMIWSAKVIFYKRIQ